MKAAKEPFAAFFRQSQRDRGELLLTQSGTACGTCYAHGGCRSTIVGAEE